MSLFMDDCVLSLTSILPFDKHLIGQWSVASWGSQTVKWRIRLTPLFFPRHEGFPHNIIVMT